MCIAAQHIHINWPTAVNVSVYTHNRDALRPSLLSYPILSYRDQDWLPVIPRTGPGRWPSFLKVCKYCPVKFRFSNYSNISSGNCCVVFCGQMSLGKHKVLIHAFVWWMWRRISVREVSWLKHVEGESQRKSWEEEGWQEQQRAPREELQKILV